MSDTDSAKILLMCKELDSSKGWALSDGRTWPDIFDLLKGVYNLGRESVLKESDKEIRALINRLQSLGVDNGKIAEAL